MKPKVVWAAEVNLNGLCNRKPVRCTYNEELLSWWDKTGNLEVTSLGMVQRSGYVEFASKSRKEVEIWIEGALAILWVLANFARLPED